MKWTKKMPGISLILAGIVTANMKVVTGFVGYHAPLTESAIYTPLVYVIGGLLIIAGAFMIYNEDKDNQA
jgi:uncharacterized membrane protein YhdT